MSKPRRKFIALFAVLLCAVVALSTVFLLPNKTANAATRSGNWNEIGSSTDDLYKGDGDTKPFDSDLLSILYNALTGEDTIEGVESKLTSKGGTLTSADFRAQQGGASTGPNVSVWFGKIKWDVVYMTFARDNVDKNGDGKPDIVLDLWQSADGANSIQGEQGLLENQYQINTINKPDNDFPSNMYSVSVVRVQALNAGGYVTTSDANLDTTKKKQSTSNLYARFTMEDPGTGVDSLIKYIVLPADVPYQETENNYGNSNVNNSLVNDAYGLDTEQYDGEVKFYNENFKNYVKKGDDSYPESKYDNWKNDYLWLPSLAETGSTETANQNGMWKTNKDLRSTVTSFSWLRSGAYHNAASSTFLDTSGGYGYGATTDKYSLRPALHFNLSLADANSDAGPKVPSLPEEVELTKTFTYDGTEKTFDLSKYTETLSFSNPSLTNAFDADTLTLKATNAGEYTVDALPIDGEWADGSTEPVTFRLIINPKPIELEIQLSGTSHEVNLPPESIKASIKTPPDGVFADGDDWQTLCKSAKFSVTTDGGGLFTLDDLLNKPAGKYTVSAELSLDNYKVTIKPVTYEITVHVTHTYNGEAVHIAGTTSHNVYCSFAYCTAYETKSCNISSQTAVPATCTADGYTEYECSGCGSYKIVGEGALGHDFKDQPWNKGDETNHWHVCVRGDITGDIQPHQWQRGEEFWGGEGGTRTDTCTICGKSVTVTLEAGAVYVPSNAATYIYNGAPQEIQLSDFNPSTMQLEYYAQNKTNRLDGAPTNAGTYYVKVTLTDSSIKFEGIEERFVWIEFRIEKKPIILEIELSCTGHEIGNAPESITARLKSPKDGVFVGGDNFEELCRGVQFTVTDCDSLADLISAAVGTYTVKGTLVLDNYEVTITSTTYKIVAHEHSFEGQEWQSDENNHWHDCVQGDAIGDVQPHNWNNGIITREPTEDMAGEKTFTCETCGATRTESVPYVPDGDDPNDNDHKPGEDLERKKDEAKDALDEAAKKKKEEIDNSDMSDEEKQQAKDKVDEELQKGKDAIDSATSASGVEQATDEAKRNIENIGFKSGGSSFPWWIIAFVAGVLVLAAVLIIIIVTRRQTADGDDGYDQYYDDEYDFVEEEYEEDGDDF